MEVLEAFEGSGHSSGFGRDLAQPAGIKGVEAAANQPEEGGALVSDPPCRVWFTRVGWVFYQVVDTMF